MDSVAVRTGRPAGTLFLALYSCHSKGRICDVMPMWDLTDPTRPTRSPGRLVRMDGGPWDMRGNSMSAATEEHFGLGRIASGVPPIFVLDPANSSISNGPTSGRGDRAGTDLAGGEAASAG
jgi:hypothetical protein